MSSKMQSAVTNTISALGGASQGASHPDVKAMSVVIECPAAAGGEAG
jgi:hypothetical protein